MKGAKDNVEIIKKENDETKEGNNGLPPFLMDFFDDCSPFFF